MNVFEHITLSNVKDGLEYTFHIQKAQNQTWEKAKDAAREIYEQVTILEAQDKAAKAAQPAAEVQTDLVTEEQA